MNQPCCGKGSQRCSTPQCAQAPTDNNIMHTAKFGKASAFDSPTDPRGKRRDRTDAVAVWIVKDEGMHVQFKTWMQHGGVCNKMQSTVRRNACGSISPANRRTHLWLEQQAIYHIYLTLVCGRALTHRIDR
jgi:hypothetical protein